MAYKIHMLTLFSIFLLYFLKKCPFWREAFYFYLCHLKSYFLKMQNQSYDSMFFYANPLKNS